MEGGILVVEVPKGDPDTGVETHAHCEADIDLSDFLVDGKGAVLRVRVRARDISKPDRNWNGVKCMFRYVSETTGQKAWPGFQFPLGSFDWREATVRVNWLHAQGLPKDGRATIVLGLQGCTGHAEFDLSTLTIESEDLGIPRVNENWIVRYPDDPVPVDANDRAPQGGAMEGTPTAQMKGVALQQMEGAPTAQMNEDPSSAGTAGIHHSAEGGPSFSGAAGTLPFRKAAPSLPSQRRKPLRGTMLPGRDTTEDDIETLHSWGATLVRFQITRNWHKVNDNQDLDEYGRWINRRVDNLTNVLDWCQTRGMKVCIDLHQPPGGKWGIREGQPLEMNMFSDDRYAEAFLDTWRNIATRVKGHPAIYGYDLINEPTQRGPVKHNYWDLQRRAAEVIREIDPGTPIVFAANLANSAPAFRYLSPLAMDNVIYQAHVYLPGGFTHQGVNSKAYSTPEEPLTWPGKDPITGETWDKEWLRRAIQPIRDFQLKHHCRIYVGEFSAAAWAPGAENYLRDCIDLFEEYGWDWTYHAFRESPVWDVDMMPPEGVARPTSKDMIPAAEDTPRKRALLDGFAR